MTINIAQVENYEQKNQPKRSVRQLNDAINAVRCRSPRLIKRLAISPIAQVAVLTDWLGGWLGLRRGVGLFFAFFALGFVLWFGVWHIVAVDAVILYQIKIDLF